MLEDKKKMAHEYCKLVIILKLNSKGNVFRTQKKNCGAANYGVSLVSQLICNPMNANGQRSSKQCCHPSVQTFGQCGAYMFTHISSIKMKIIYKTYIHRIQQLKCVIKLNKGPFYLHILYCDSTFIIINIIFFLVFGFENIIKVNHDKFDY